MKISEQLRNIVKQAEEANEYIGGQKKSTKEIAVSNGAVEKLIL